jgi:hypothetical protein
VRAWAAKYRDLGLVVIGVHTPEFPFEREVDKVREAAQEMRVEYPLALDSDYGVWSAFANRYWPAAYLADAEGRIRYHHFGEGEYDEGRRGVRLHLRLATDSALRRCRYTSGAKRRTNYGPPRRRSTHLNGQPWPPASMVTLNNRRGPIWGSRGREFKSRQPDQTDGRHPT